MDRLLKDQLAAISSWVRAHGELTDYSDLENNDYEAYIVKASELVTREGEEYAICSRA